MTHAQAILTELRSKRSGLSDYALYHRLRARGLKASPSSVRTRRSELQKAGRVKDTGRVEPTPAGRSARIWAAA